jgi:hypothetical protein
MREMFPPFMEMSENGGVHAFRQSLEVLLEWGQIGGPAWTDL